MHTWQSSYEIVGDCSDKGGHRYQPLDRFILQEVLARRRKIFMLRVMSTLFLIKCFGIELALYDLYVTRFVLTKGLLFDTFFNIFLQIVSL